MPLTKLNGNAVNRMAGHLNCKFDVVHAMAGWNTCTLWF